MYAQPLFYSSTPTILSLSHPCIFTSFAYLELPLHLFSSHLPTLTHSLLPLSATPSPHTHSHSPSLPSHKLSLPLPASPSPSPPPFPPLPSPPSPPLLQCRDFCFSKHPEVLPKLLSAVKWNEPAAVAEVSAFGSSHWVLVLFWLGSPTYGTWHGKRNFFRGISWLFRTDTRR